MRKSVACLGLCFLLAHAGIVFGQSKTFPPSFSDPEPEIKKQATTPRAKVVRTPAAERLIHQRAIRQAENRRARIEARHWRGVSLLRPLRNSNINRTDFNRYDIGYNTWWGWAPQYFRISDNR